MFKAKPEKAAPLTKDDIRELVSLFVTSEEAKDFVTKRDLRDALEPLVTKKDLKDSLDEAFDRFAPMVARGFSDIEVRISEIKEDLSSFKTQAESDMADVKERLANLERASGGRYVF